MKIEHHIHVHYHHDTDTKILQIFDQIQDALRTIITQGEMLMAIDKVFVKTLNEVTDAIAVRMQKLLDANRNQTPLTPEEEAQVEADVARLQAMGKDENNPVPA